MRPKPTPASIARTLILFGLAFAALGACASHPSASRGSPAQGGGSGSAPQPPASPTPGPSQAQTRSPLVVQGTGALVALPQTEAPSPPSPAGNGFELNFTDTEISLVVSTVLGEGLNLPYVVDPQVKGKITLRVEPGAHPGRAALGARVGAAHRGRSAHRRRWRLPRRPRQGGSTAHLEPSARATQRAWLRHLCGATSVRRGGGHGEGPPAFRPRRRHRQGR